MNPIPLAWAALWLAQIPQPLPSDGPPPEAQSRAEALSKYNELRPKAADTAAAQWKLALWCGEHGLKGEEATHLAAVVRLDPARDPAWKKLGFRKVDGRWLTPEQVAADEASRADERQWGPKLKAIHKKIHDPRRRGAAEDELAKVDTPGAVSSIYREFGVGGGRDQLIAIQALGAIEGPVSSKVLATLAVYGKSDEVRRAAIETLKPRPVAEYLDVFVDLMKETLTYEVRPVAGPGSAGVLYVEGDAFNLRRFYAPPKPPDIAPGPGDLVSYDADGMLVITRPIQHFIAGVPGSKTMAMDVSAGFQVSAAQGLADARRAAASAQSQLEEDVRQVGEINVGRERSNDLIMAAARRATGKDPGDTPKAWRTLLGSEDEKYAREPAKRTWDQLVPVAYTPTAPRSIFFVTRFFKDS